MTYAASCDQIRQIEAASRRQETPCGEGSVVWHLWGAGPPLVLLHGGAGSWRHWARNVIPLAQNRLVVAPDLPGLGESDLPAGSRDVDTLAGIIAEGIERLLGTEQSYELAGFSFGSLISGRLALRHRERITRMTIVGASSLGTPRAPTPLEKVRSRTGDDRIAAHRTNLARLMIGDPARIDDLAVVIQAWNSDHARLKERPPPDTAPLREALAQLSIPLRAFWGELDATCAGPILQQRVEAIRTTRPDATVQVLPGAGHWAPFEVAERWNEFFAE